MKRLVIGLLGLVLAAIVLGALLGRLLPSQQAYTVAEVQAGLQHQPQAWSGRTVRVRGWLAGWASTACVRTPTGLKCRGAREIVIAPVWPPNGANDPMTANLIVLLRAGAPLPPGLDRPDIPLFLLSGLHALLPTAFPRSGSMLFRVRLRAAHTCPRLVGMGPGPPCAAGMLLTP
jgi:hypothetical protein